MNTIIILIWVHFLADFVLQSNWVATNKSTKTWVLGLHSLVYAMPLVILGWRWAIANGVLHFGVDYITSRMTSEYHMADRRHAFFVTIGADQAIHMTILILTHCWMAGV